MAGILYLVSTPIGNLEDITLRALRILKEVDLIAAEDTRHTKKLLNHYQIGTLLTSYFEHNKITKGEYIKKLLLEGKNIALVTDAGTPGISDPGEMIVRDCINAGVKVVSIPGPTALIASLSISGLPADKFLFQGFLPRREKEKREILRDLLNETATLVFYESPHRIKETLQVLSDILGSREAVIIRELTKVYEEVKRGRLDELVDFPLTLKGEFCIIVSGQKDSSDLENAANLKDDEIKILVKSLQKEKGISLKGAVKQVAYENNISVRKIYQMMIKDSNKQ